MAKKLCGTNYPLSICFIVVNEFCERFSYYGMKAVLTLYFLSYLKWDKDLSTAVYHAFSGLCYFTPILGALIADSWLGKFKTIIYLSIVYVIGHVIKSVGAIPTVGNKDVHIALSMLGLILIAFGTGGIKPCVAAFGGDQFDEDSMKERQKFFSIFYMSINAGSLLSTVITPVLRGDVKCFGEDCYALAFGVPAALMMVALAVFIFGSSLYKKNPPQGNILLQVCNCIGFAIKNRWNSSKSAPKRTHWLDWAEDKYSKRLIEEIRMVLRVLVLYIPLPMFWALFDQQGSRWTLQATRMNLAFGESFTIKPDQMQMLNALMILLFVPIFDLIIYPLVSLCRINIRPLRKMATGMIFAALAFGAATLVEVNVVKTVVEPAPAGKCLLQVYNLAGRDISVKVPDNDVFPDPIKDLQDLPNYETLLLEASSKVLGIAVTLSGKESVCEQTFEEQKAYSLIIYNTNSGIKCKMVEDYIKKNEDGNPNIRFFNTRPEPVNLTVGREQFYVPSDYSMTPNKSVDRGEYPSVNCSARPETCDSLNLGLLDFGASYTFILLQESGTIVAKRMEDVEANNVHIAWQIPQYVLLTAGEVMFSITGLEFSYSQAPTNMKSVLQAGWLLTVAFGNVIVLIVAEGAGLEQWKEFLLFAGLLLGVCVIFSIMAYFYTNNDPEQLDKIFLEDSRWDEDEDDNMKKKNEEIQLNKAGKSTRL
ncbi:solute carrier family 15 member 2 isoform X3 [Nothobranchius furzeri]|uniref:Solute carrier family 15 (H+/peptide transporter), member 2 n=2 Tax=Nothobranchius furzeri TaxID=105023 RepID=A0A1A8V0Z4_NOTFU|nr:solute carrier family 15 member 2 isoform X3 [Nothobranchius furzeri]KAF7215353.1 transcript variant X2 [Nothobranchius furzeri]KAF7215354.1 transcript variant X3 [Nothobranchius furzeri]KAF7215355.1 transcript variant X1 [Nothobranchius furzeri]